MGVPTGDAAKQSRGTPMFGDEQLSVASARTLLGGGDPFAGGGGMVAASESPGPGP
jgi:hypothetical protein